MVPLYVCSAGRSSSPAGACRARLRWSAARAQGLQRARAGRPAATRTAPAPARAALQRVWGGERACLPHRVPPEPAPAPARRAVGAGLGRGTRLPLRDRGLLRRGCRGARRGRPRRRLLLREPAAAVAGSASGRGGGARVARAESVGHAQQHDRRAEALPASTRRAQRPSTQPPGHPAQHNKASNPALAMAAAGARASRPRLAAPLAAMAAAWMRKTHRQSRTTPSSSV